MHGYFRTLFLSFMLCIACVGSALAGPITYRFDSFADGSALTNQYAGLQFSNATVVRNGVSLNGISFPPRSGDGAVFDDGGAIVITFGRPASSVSGYFTYLDGLTLTAYDSADNLLDVATAEFITNVGDGSGDTGSLPNELIGVASGGSLIARIVVSGAPGGASVVLDDLNVTIDAVAIPEPGTLSLVWTGLAAAFACTRRGRRRSASI